MLPEGEGELGGGETALEKGWGEVVWYRGEYDFEEFADFLDVFDKVPYPVLYTRSFRHIHTWLDRRCSNYNP